MAEERQRSRSHSSHPTAFWFNPNCKTKIKIWLRTILILISFIFILPLTIVSALYRSLISVLSHCLRPDLANIFSLHSSVFIVENVQVQMCRNILLRFKMHGQLNFESLKTRFVERFVKAINPSTRQLVRPELQQYHVKWFGYDFWKWESGFNIDEHIIHRRNDAAAGEVARGTITNEEMNEIEIQFLKTPFELYKSPWQIVIIDNIEQHQQGQNDEPSFLVLFKFHHSLCDGLSLFNALMECADEQLPALEAPSPSRRPFLLELLSWIIFPFQAAYTYARLTEQKMVKSPWDVDCVDQSVTLAKQVHVVRSTHLDKTRVKKLASDLQVSFTAVLLAAITGGIRNFLLRDKKLVEVPEYMVVEVPFPVERHADGLTNDVCVVSFILPVGCPDIGQRITICEQSVTATKSSIEAKMTHILFDLFALLPGCVLPYKFPPAAVSIFPGPLKSAKFCGQELFEMSYVQLLVPIVFMMTILTYGDGLQFYCNGDSRVFIQDDIQHIVKCIEDEIGNMEENVAANDGVNEWQIQQPASAKLVT